MITNNLDLNAMGLVSLNETEAINVKGGGNPVVNFFIDYLLGKLVDKIVDGYKEANKLPARSLTDQYIANPYI